MPDVQKFAINGFPKKVCVAYWEGARSKNLTDLPMVRPENGANFEANLGLLISRTDFIFQALNASK